MRCRRRSAPSPRPRRTRRRRGRGGSRTSCRRRRCRSSRRSRRCRIACRCRTQLHAVKVRKDVSTYTAPGPFDQKLLIGYGAIATVMLGEIERLVGPLDEGLLVLRVRWHAGDAEGQRDVEGALVGGESLLADVEANALG